MLSIAQEDQIKTVKLDKLYLTGQNFKHLLQQELDLFLYSWNVIFFLFREIWLEVFSTTVKEEANRFP